MADPFKELERRARRGLTVHRADIESLTPAVMANCDAHGRATPRLRRSFLSLEAVAARWLTDRARSLFQQLVAQTGAQMRGRILLPEDDTPYWQIGSHPLADFRSRPQLPSTADVVVIGAGLTGASTAWHLSTAVRSQGLRVVVLEYGDPASQASGRNGGNFELIPENFLGEYQGLPAERRKWIARRYPWLSKETVDTAADRQARLILEFGSRNSARFLSVVRGENIECDLSDTGWIRIADTPEEQRGIIDEVEFANRVGVHFELLSPKRIRQETGIAAKYAGRKAAPNGNYHPFKFVCGVLDRAIGRGVQLFTRTPVVGVTPARKGLVRLETPRGFIDARRVIFATNAFTSTLLSEMRAIQYFQSQVLNLEHVLDTIGGMTITEKKGDLYYNFPRARKYRDAKGVSRGMLLAGGGLDRRGMDPFFLRRSSTVLDLVLEQAGERFPETCGQPPSRVWTGPMAFTPDRVPVIGFLRRKGFPHDSIIVAAGFNGYGGTYCVEAGRLSALMARTGETPPEIPEDMFSPHRFLTRRPLYPVWDNL
jgi:glycine/D-amino acid oxidase-like deaminating enzyme